MSASALPAVMQRDGTRALPASRAGAASRLLTTRLWLALLALICAAQLATHTGSRNGFLASSGPLYSGNDLLPAEGYVSWAGTAPVLHDADGVFTVVALFLGGRDAAESGILDRRAAYAYLASLVVPWAGPYGGFLVLNGLFWWGTSAAAFWFVRRRWEDQSLARATSFLVATGHGFLFMAGVPMSYLAAYACAMLLLALGEWLRAFSRPQLISWLILGWGAGVASTIYFTHFVLLIFWWLYGLRRVPWRHLLAATTLVFAISLSWEVVGRRLVGLEFTTDNSGLIGDSVTRWLRHLRESWFTLVTYFRATTLRETLLGAFAIPWWVLAAIGLPGLSKDDREWSLSVVMAGLLPTIVLLALLPLPRLAYYMYPALYVLAARGAMQLGRATGALFDHLGLPASACRGAATVAVTLALGTLAVTSNLDLLGYHGLNARFHFSTTAGW